MAQSGTAGDLSPSPPEPHQPKTEEVDETSLQQGEKSGSEAPGSKEQGSDGGVHDKKNVPIEQKQSTAALVDVDQEELQRVLKKLKSVLPSEQSQRAEDLVKRESLFQNEVLELVLLLLDRPDATTTENQQSRSSRFLPTVRICPVVTGQTFGADGAILKQVEIRKWIERTVVQTTGLQDCDIIMLFCPITSRAGADVEAALSRDEVSSSNKHIILVLMYHTRDVDFSEGGTRWTEKNQRVVLEVPVLFHETQSGLLQCDTNRKAVSKIKKELNKHSKRR